MGEYEEIRRLTLEEFMEETYKMLKERGKLSIRKKHWRYLIKNKELTCVSSGKEVSYCSYMENTKSGTFHYNFYSENGDLFTIDHKLPKSQGGTNSVKNIQPMLSDDNWDKGDQMIYL